MGRFPTDGVAVAADDVGVTVCNATAIVAEVAGAAILVSTAVPYDGDGSADGAGGVMTLTALVGDAGAGAVDIGVARD